MALVVSSKVLKGLNTYENQLAIERGYTLVADNCVLDRKGYISNRSGFDYFDRDTDGEIQRLAEYNGYLIDHLSDNSLGRRTQSNGTRTAYSGTYEAPADYKVSFTSAQRNLYFTTSNGIYRLAGATSEPIEAGTPEALDTRVATSGTGGGFLSGSTKVSYKIVWKRKDGNGRTTYGKPSFAVDLANNTRRTVGSITRSTSTATVTTNDPHGYTTGDTILISGAGEIEYNGNVEITVTGATTFTYTVSGSPTTPATGTILCEKKLDVDVSFTVPADYIAGDEYEVYRTLQTSSVSVEPSSEYYLVTNGEPVGGASSVETFNDTIDDEFLIAPLYTNEDSGEGALNANYRPPCATDIATFNGYTFYAQTALQHQLIIKLISVAGLTDDTSAISLNDGFVTTTYTFSTAENVAERKFERFTAGDVASNIENTMRSFCAVVNQDNQSYYAEYISGPIDDPGIVRIWARQYSNPQFTITANNSTTGGVFLPELPETGESYSSSNDAHENRLFFSKYQQPDAVPLTNYLDIGTEDARIERILVLRNALFVMKEDGVFMVQGLGAPFATQSLDSTVRILAPYSAAPLSNAIFLYSNQGFVQLNENGVRIISIDIEPEAMAKQTLPNIRLVTHAIGDEFRRQYICWMPQGTGDAYAHEAYVYHNIHQQWTRWTKRAGTSTIADSTRNIFISSGQEQALLKLRTAGTSADYADESVEIAVIAQSGRQLTINWTDNVLFPITVGYTIHQGNDFAKIINYTALGSNSYEVEIDRDTMFTAGEAQAWVPIQSEIQFPPDPCGEAGVTKIFQSSTFYIAEGEVTRATLLIASNESPTIEEIEYEDTDVSLGWGISAWGDVAWGDSQSRYYKPAVTVTIPVGKNTGEALMTGFRHAVATEAYKLGYRSISFENGAEVSETGVDG